MMTASIEQVGGFTFGEDDAEGVQVTILIPRAQLDADEAAYDPAVTTSITPTAARRYAEAVVAAYRAALAGA